MRGRLKNTASFSDDLCQTDLTTTCYNLSFIFLRADGQFETGRILAQKCRIQGKNAKSGILFIGQNTAVIESSARPHIFKRKTE